MDAVERLNRRLLLLAAALGLLAALAAHAYLQGLARRVLVPQTVPVVVARVDIPAHTTVTSAMVDTAQYEPADRPTNALAGVGAAIGATTTVDIYRGQPLVGADVSDAAAPLTLSYAIPVGMRAFALQASDTTAVAELIRPGDLVDVLAVFTGASGSSTGSSGGQAATTVDTLAQALKVLAVGQRTVGQATPVPASYTTVTLEVTPAQAAQLAYASSRAGLVLTLRAVSDSTTVEVAPETGAEIPGAHP